MRKSEFLKKAKIVATLGPATNSVQMITKLVRAGMDVIRLNFSHGDYEGHANIIKVTRHVSKKLGKPITIIQDLAGPKIRIGEFYKERININKGNIFTLTTEKIIGDETKVYVNYKKLPSELKRGRIILLNDGREKLKVVSVSQNKIKCKILIGGEIKNKCGVNIPGAYLKIDTITLKDKKDIAFGIKNKVDFVALSFVRSPKDIIQLRNILNKKKSDMGIIAKIETKEAIDNIDEIIALSDCIMIARGDLAIEVPTQDVPLLQKMIIKKCNVVGKPVITATQMLESMIHSPVPTRAEVSDVANSIFDGTDAVMLSEETALGNFPLEAVNMMTDVVRRVGNILSRRKIKDNKEIEEIVDAVTHSVVHVAEEVGAKVIVSLTESGFTGRMIARFRPTQPIIVMSPNKNTCRKLTLSYGCYSVLIRGFEYVVQVTDVVNDFVLKHKLAKKGDRVIIVAGVPFGKVGGTNLLLVHVV